jgi:hypothetical protein
MSVLAWDMSPVRKPGAGIPTRRVASCCLEHAGQTSRVHALTWVPGSPLITNRFKDRRLPARLQRLEKLLEDTMIKITSVAADGLKAKSVVAMVAALAAGERDPGKLADLVKGPDREAATHQGKHGTEERTALAFVVGDGHRPELRELAEVTFGRVAPFIRVLRCL